MLGLTRIPRTVYEFLYQFQPHFRCAQARHFQLFCWLLMMLIVETGKGTVKGLSRRMPARIRYWALLRMVRSGQWAAQELLADMAGQVVRWLPPPADGVLYLIGDPTLKGKRGQQHPLGRKAKLNEYAGYTFGFEMVLLLAQWGPYRIPVALDVVDPKQTGHANQLFRQMLQTFVPPAWVRQVIVVADAGMAANETFRVLKQQGYDFVFAQARTRKFTDGKYLRDLVQHLPKCHYHRVASYKPDGRRKDYWIYSRHATLQTVGDVTIVLSKGRRNLGPKKVKIIVTNLKTKTAGEILSIYARRWGVEVTIKELKSGLHLGQMQVTKDPARVRRSVILSVLAYLLLVRLYGREDAGQARFSLFALKQRFTMDVFHDQLARSERKWQAKLEQYKAAA